MYYLIKMHTSLDTVFKEELNWNKMNKYVLFVNAIGYVLDKANARKSIFRYHAQNHYIVDTRSLNPLCFMFCL